MSRIGSYVVELQEKGLWEFDENREPNFDEYYEEQFNRFDHCVTDIMENGQNTWSQAVRKLYQQEEDDYEMFDLTADAYCYQKLEHWLYKWDLAAEKIEEICNKFFFSP